VLWSTGKRHEVTTEAREGLGDITMTDAPVVPEWAKMLDLGPEDGLMTLEEGLMSDEYQRIRVLVETTERSFKGYVFKPRKDDDFRLSDHLNTYGKEFLCLTDVEVADRGQHYRVGEKRDFVAIAVHAITYLTPLEPDK
jgi:hypothetical protein